MDNPDGDIRGHGDYYFTIWIGGTRLVSSTTSGEEVYDPYLAFANVSDDKPSIYISVTVEDSDSLSSDDKMDVSESVKKETYEMNFDITKDEISKTVDGSEDGDAIDDGYMEITITTVQT